MFEVEESDLRIAIDKTKKICTVIRYAFLAATILYATTLVFSLGALILSEPQLDAGILFGALVYVAVRGAVIILCLVAMVMVFTDVVRGKAPFSTRQANRIRLIALLALLLVLLELAFTASVSYNLIPEVGYSIGINDAYPTDSINLNVGMLAFSAIMYSLSALFRYAALLQQLSDDTV
ncbi:MAG: hypothetical protein HFJ67_06930 [Adlercreutzia mucosicola]|nr:hypothetical protein [Adlercreutzia mucosicola]